MSTDANSILMGSGAPAAKFHTIGTIITGTVTQEPEARQQTDFRTGVPETWKDGSPKMQILVQLSTALRDPQRADDDGTRTVYIKGKELTKAIRDAVRACGANGIHTGGSLTVQYIADGPAEPGLEKGPKLYAAQYTAPAVSFAGITGPAAQQAPAPTPAPVQQPIYQAAPAVQQPVYQPAPMPQQPAPVAASVLGAPAGVDPTMWARLAPDQRERVIAAMGVPLTAQQTGF